MDLEAYREELRLKLTGGILDLELDDAALDKVINSAFREVQRYIDTTRLATIPYSGCIDLNGKGVSSVSRVFRAQGFLGGGTQDNTTLMADPMYAAQWQLLSGSGNMYNMQNWIYNYGAWNTLLQIRNTTSTDLQFRFDKHTNQLYINVAMDRPQYITIEYVPLYTDVSEVVSDYWIDIILRMATAQAKIILGRIRSRYTQSNALWTQDGEQMLEEGTTELTELREVLRTQTQLNYPID